MELDAIVGLIFVLIAPVALLVVTWHLHSRRGQDSPPWRQHLLSVGFGTAILNAVLFYVFLFYLRSVSSADVEQLRAATTIAQCGAAISILGVIFAVGGRGRRSRLVLVVGSIIAIVVWIGMQLPLADWRAAREARNSNVQH